MEFEVPQFIEVEDKVVGPLSLKQFGWLAGGVIILFVLFLFLNNFKIFMIFAVIIAPLTIFVALKKIQGKSVPEFIIAWLNYQIKPKLYLWKRK